MAPPQPLLDGAALIHNAVAFQRHRILKQLVGDGTLEVLDRHTEESWDWSPAAGGAAAAGSGAVAAMNWSQAASSKSSSSSCCGAARCFSLAARAFAISRWRSLSSSLLRLSRSCWAHFFSASTFFFENRSDLVAAASNTSSDAQFAATKAFFSVPIKD